MDSVLRRHREKALADGRERIARKGGPLDKVMLVLNLNR